MYAECFTQEILCCEQVTLSCVQKYETEDESHELFTCNAYNRFRKEVNIIASVSAIQDTSNAPSHIMAADDEESACCSDSTLPVQNPQHAESSCRPMK